MSVEYRIVPEFFAYRIGNDGSLWTRHKMGPNPRKEFSESWREVAVYREKKMGYVCATLRKGGEGTQGHFRMVHAIVLEAFVGQRPEGMIARHFPDPDPANNNLSNLQWGTYKQNCADREQVGHTVRGERNMNAKLTEDNVREIRAATGRGCVAAMCRKYNVSRPTIHAIRNRRTWTHI